ncbi:MAG: hypothetical protein M3O29_02215 [Actinomycetota bacterium]|nr:hypothetical protein [Actinomycetota bacterium]
MGKLHRAGFVVLIVLVATVTADARRTAALATCPPDFSAANPSGSNWLTLDPNEVVPTVIERWTNVGCSSWNIGVVGSQAFAGTWTPTPGQDQRSVLGGTGDCGTDTSAIGTKWWSCQRIRPLQDIVSPGQVGEFAFGVKAPPAPGTYPIYLRPLIEGVMWMEDFGVHWQTTVRSTAGPSRYMKTVDAIPGGTLYVEGCQAGGDQSGLHGGPYPAQTGIVVLDFGQQYLDPSSGQYGTFLFNNVFHTNAEILAAAKMWVQGYWDCSSPTPTVILAVGTNNLGSITSAHGRAWSQLVTDLQSWINLQGFQGQINAAGGSDMELAWNQPTPTKNWACVMNGSGLCTDGYGVGAYRLYNYGDASGCPPFGSCDYGWTQEDVWYISWGAPPAFPLPEIYNDGTAQEWYRLSLYAKTQHGTRMTIRGAMSQYAACQVTPGCPGGGTDYTAQQGWSALWKYINDDPNTRQLGGDEMRWSTDISKGN